MEKVIKIYLPYAHSITDFLNELERSISDFADGKPLDGSLTGRGERRYFDLEKFKEKYGVEVVEPLRFYKQASRTKNPDNWCVECTNGKVYSVESHTTTTTYETRISEKIRSISTESSNVLIETYYPLTVDSIISDYYNVVNEKCNLTAAPSFLSL